MHEPICLPKFDKMSFFLDNLQHSKSQGLAEEFRRRSNSWSLAKKTCRLDHLRKEIGTDLIRKSCRSKIKIGEGRKENECTIVQTTKVSCKKMYSLCKQNSLSKLDGLEANASAKRSDQNKVSTVKAEKGRTIIETEVHEYTRDQVRLDIPAKCKKNTKKRFCSLNNEEREILATVLLINPNARQNISLARHGSLPPLRL